MQPGPREPRQMSGRRGSVRSSCPFPRVAECHGEWRKCRDASILFHRLPVPRAFARRDAEGRIGQRGWTRARPAATSRAGMFTGLVTHTGTLAARLPRGPGARLAFDVAFDDGPLVLGESIAVDGACLSVATIADGGFEVDASAETLARTTLGRLRDRRPGAPRAGAPRRRPPGRPHRDRARRRRGRSRRAPTRRRGGVR